MNEECAALMNVLFYTIMLSARVLFFFLPFIYSFILTQITSQKKKQNYSKEEGTTKRIYDQIKNIRARY